MARLRFGPLLLVLLLASTPSLADGTRGDPAARLLSGEFASERWELTAQFDSGHLLFAEFLITNFGLGDRNAVVVGHVVEPGGETHRFRNGRREGRWQLSPDRLRIEVGSSLLDQHLPVYRLRVDKRNVRVDLGFRPDGRAAWSDGLAPSGYALDLLAAAAPVEGTLWVEGMEAPVQVSGAVALTHSWTNEAESNLVLRRIEFFFLRQDCPLYVVDLTTPSGARARWLVVKRQGQPPYESRDFDLVLDGEVGGSRSQGYPAPRAFRLQGQRVEGHVELGRVLLRHDPLTDLPQPFRFLVALKMRPQRVWASSPVEASFQPDQSAPAPAPVSIRGGGVTKVTFLNPLPPPQPEAAAQMLEGSRADRRLDQPPGRP